ncbi:hypothetical protein FHX40_1000 [Thermopolyspora flexuosa]|uniref:Uncharacterized protein n=1 Tax=Thermopolyspora flexuosa TaxID=103836 RepID=A0A543IUU4_9ACTN|nr:hypothetical protein FHX40_1000 [Thermopolyspora flexuosa]
MDRGAPRTPGARRGPRGGEGRGGANRGQWSTRAAGVRTGVDDRRGYGGREAPGASAAGAGARSGSFSSRSPLVDHRLPVLAVGEHAPLRTCGNGPLAAAEEAFHHLPWPIGSGRNRRARSERTIPMFRTKTSNVSFVRHAGMLSGIAGACLAVSGGMGATTGYGRARNHPAGLRVEPTEKRIRASGRTGGGRTAPGRRWRGRCRTTPPGGGCRPRPARRRRCHPRRSGPGGGRLATGPPPCRHLPGTDVRLGPLRPGDTVTRRPRRGRSGTGRRCRPRRARSGAAGVGAARRTEPPPAACITTVYNDRVWSYRTPLPESREIAGPTTSFGERVDSHPDGVLQRRPKAAF